MKNKKEIILIISIDTECDKGPGWKIQHPIRFTSVTEGIPQKLSPLFNTYDIKPTYLLSPEIIQDDECVYVLKSTKNCELGTHLHGEFINTDYEDLIDRTKTPQLSYAPEVEFNKLQALTKSFELAFGYLPRSFRAGRFGISHHTLNFLEKLGYLVDSSVAPFRKIQFDGRHKVNFWGAPYFPYHPSRNNVTRIGKSNVLEVPISTIIPLYANLPLIIQRIIGQNPTLVKRILRKLGFSNRNYDLIYLRPLRASSDGLIADAEQIINLWKGNTPPILNMMFHSVEVVEGASPYTSSKEDVDLFLKSLEILFLYLKSNFDLLSLGLSENTSFLPNTHKNIK